MSAAEKLGAFLDASPEIAVVEIREVAGSAPRDVATWMLVSQVDTFGTIGGGQLEYMAIDRARRMLASGPMTDLLDVPLGPEIGQCCGGRVKVDIAVADDELRAAIPKRVEAEEVTHPHIYLFGAGHVGHALAAALSLLPVKVTVVETRQEALAGMPAKVETRLTAMPEEIVREAPSGSAFLILTHDHALDFLIVSEALRRTDASYVGMIGSKTKRATFRTWYLKQAHGSDQDFARLVCPIGGDAVKDRRPAVIAAMAAAEVMTALAAATAFELHPGYARMGTA